jgi:phage terminase small subunit
MVRGLTPKQERFCHEYLVDSNGTQAAIRAGYSKRTAGSLAERLLKNVDISRRIEELEREILDKLKLTKEKVLARLELIAFGTIEGIVSIESGEARVKDTATMHPDKLAIIQSIKVNERGRVSVSIHPQMPALLELARITGLSGDVNLAIATMEKYGVKLRRKDDGTWFIGE